MYHFPSPSLSLTECQIVTLRPTVSRSVGQSVLVSRSIWVSWPDIYFCLTFIHIRLWDPDGLRYQDGLTDCLRNIYGHLHSLFHPSFCSFNYFLVVRASCIYLWYQHVLLSKCCRNVKDKYLRTYKVISRMTTIYKSVHCNSQIMSFGSLFF
jgi:hypothetical protein